MENCDTLFMVGSSFPYIEFLPKPGDAKGVQIDSDPKRIGLRFPVQAGLAGDSRAVLRELLPRFDHKQDRSFLDKAREGMKKWRKTREERATRPAKPMKPQVIAP